MSSPPAAMEKQTPCDYHPYQSHSWIQLHEVVVEKEYQLECSKDELQRLLICEAENKRKDDVIMALRKEITEYKKCTQSGDIRYASVEGRLQSSESHLQDKIKEVQKLQSELEKTHEKLKSTTSKSATVQKELSQLSHANTQQCQELKELRNQHKCDTDTIAALRAEIAEKKRRVKKMRSENQELQKRLEYLQANQESMATSENQLKAEIARLKNLSSSGKLLQAKYDFSEQELLKAKDRENAMAVEMGKLESELSVVCSHVLACFQVPRTEEEASPQVAIQVITQFADSCLKAEEKLALCEQDLEKHEEGQVALNNGVLQLCKLWKEFQEGVKSDMVGALNLLADGLQKSGSEDRNLNEVMDRMAESTSNLYSLTEQGQGQLSSLRDHIASSFKALPEHNATEESDVSVMVTNMASSLQSSILQITELKQQLLDADQEHTASLSGAVAVVRQEESKRIQDAVEATRLEEREKASKEMESVREVLVSEKQEAILQEQEAVASLRKELEAVKLSTATETEEKEALQAELDDMRTNLATAELGKSEAISAADSYKETLNEQCTEKISGFKEQAQQYAFTIVAMEGKLLKMLEKTKAIQSENQSLQERLDDVVTTSVKEADGHREKIQKLEELVRVLRNQLGLTSEGVGQREAVIKQLESAILDLGQEAEESRAQLKHEHVMEVSDLQLTMAKQEAVMECQKTELDALAGNLREKTSDLEEAKQGCVKMAEELSAIQKEVADIGTMNDMDDKQRQFLLTETGHVCLGERHNDIISNQKTAIAQLREKLAELELAKPPIGSHQATLKELSRVRHELLKVKSDAQRFKTDEKDTVTTTQSQSTSRPQFAFMEGNKSQEAALQQLEDTFQSSERMYKNLVEAICKGMPDLTRCPLEDADQLVPTDEQAKKKQLVKDRKKFADTVYRKLKLQTELQASIRSGASKSLREDASGMEEEAVEEKTPQEVIKDLECALSATAEELEQQRRLNQSLIRRKNFKETQLLASLQKPRHKCKSS